MAELKIGDEVKYSAKFLRSIGVFTGPLPFARGTIEEIRQSRDGLIIAVIHWHDGYLPEKTAVNVNNLIKKGQIEND